jgi:hypothetical protein
LKVDYRGNQALPFERVEEVIGDPRDARAIREGDELVALPSIAGVKERQVQHWVAGTHRPKGAKRDRLLELVYIVDRLRDVYRPEGIDIWIHGRNRDLGGRRPIDLLEQGDFATVLNAVERLETGAM